MTDLPQEPKLGFAEGARALFRGVGWVIASPRVWPLAMIPALLAIVLVVSATVFGFLVGERLLPNAVTAAPLSAGSASGLAGAGLALLHFLASLILFVVSAIVGVVVGLSLAQPLSAPALDAIAKMRARELGVTDFVETRALPSMARSLRVVGLALVVGLPLLLLLSAVTLIFPPASVVTLPAKFVVAAWLAAWDIFDYPFSFGAVGVRARLAWLRRNAGAAFTFGLAFAAVALVPGLGLFVIPMGVAGATDLFVRSTRRRGAPLITAEREK